MAKKYKDFDPALFDFIQSDSNVSVDNNESSMEIKLDNQENLMYHIAEDLIGDSNFEREKESYEIKYVDDRLDQSLVAELELSSLAEVNLADETKVLTRTNEVDYQVSGNKVDQEAFISETENEEPLVLLDQVFEDDQPIEDLNEPGNEAILWLGNQIQENRPLASQEYSEPGDDEFKSEDSLPGPEDERELEEASIGYASQIQEEAEEEITQYPLEPWPIGFKGGDEQPVEYLLATMEDRIFKKHQSRRYLVPQGGNEINWEAHSKLRLRGL
jgi:hypothetical protein